MLCCADAISTEGVTRAQSIATVAASVEAAVVAAGGSVLVDLTEPEVGLHCVYHAHSSHVVPISVYKACSL